MVSPMPAIRCRQIDAGDVPAVADLLTRGFPYRSRQFWHRALDHLTRHEPPPDLPKYGYLLETGGTPVGAILMICSTMRVGATVAPRCNLSSWYVDPEYRAYAPLLVSQALRHKEVTYLNVSAAPHTWPIIEAQGFSRYSEGIFISLPALKRAPAGEKVKSWTPRTSRRRLRTVRTGRAAGTRRARLYQPVVRNGGARLSIRISAALRQRRHPLRATDLLSRYRGFRPLRRAARPLSRAARPADRHCRQQRADTRPHRHFPPRQQAEIFQRPATSAARRSRLYRIRDLGRVAPVVFPPCAGMSGDNRIAQIVSAWRTRAGHCANSTPCVANSAERQAIDAESDAAGVRGLPAALRRFQVVPKWSR